MTDTNQRASRASAPLEDLLLRIVDIGLACVLLLAPWFMGGRHPLGQLVLVVISVVVATAWVTRQAVSRTQTTWKISAGELLLLSAIVLVIFQLTPLPGGVLQSLSPRLTGLLPLWMTSTEAPNALGTWNQLSLTPDATRAGLAMLLCYGLLFLVTVQRIGRIEDVERLLRWFAFSAIALASVGLLQYLTSNGKFLWIYEHPFRDTNDAVKGPFINKNHFAHLLALGLGPLVWCVQRAVSRVQAGRNPSFHDRGRKAADIEWVVMVQTVGLGVVMFAGLMTLSRGGAVAMFTALAISGALLYRVGAVSGRLILCFGLILLFVGGALAIHGYQRVTERLDDLTAGSLEELDNNGIRRHLWKADLAAARDFAAFGTGVGSHRDVYRMYLPETRDVEMTHAENGYLQVALESGVTGLALLLAGIGLATYWCLAAIRSTKNRRTYVAAVAVASSLAASALHSWGDFVWYISSCMAATVLLLACACRLMELSREGRERWVLISWRASRPGLVIATAVLVLVGGWMVSNRFRAAMASQHWDQYMAFVCSAGNEHGKLVPSEELLDHIRTVTTWMPDDSRAHAALARLTLKRFEEIQKSPDAVNPLPLHQIRDAAMQSKFSTRVDLDRWLVRGIGKHCCFLNEALRHTRLSLTSGPLHGEEYLFIAELCFLEKASVATKEAYLEQAIRVAPYNGSVLIVAGREAHLSGKPQLATDLWKRAFRCSPYERGVLISTAVSSGIGPDQFLQTYQPGWPEIGEVYKEYAKILPANEIRSLREIYLTLARRTLPKLNRTSAAAAYFEMYQQFRDADPASLAAEFLQSAVEANPNRLEYRYSLAVELRKAGDYAEAEKQVKWCLSREPQNRDMQQFLAEVVKLRVADNDGPRSQSLRSHKPH
jgi:O-antigen ligase/tetratricopeptide (TPR) repeat protein